MNYFVDLSRMSLDELLNLKIAAVGGWFNVDYTNMELLDDYINFRLEVVERMERTLNMAAVEGIF